MAESDSVVSAYMMESDSAVICLCTWWSLTQWFFAYIVESNSAMSCLQVESDSVVSCLHVGA